MKDLKDQTNSDDPTCPNMHGAGLIKDEKGAIGFIALWLLGVPASLLLVVFLMRGCT